jgi:hypothetical protein
MHRVAYWLTPIIAVGVAFFLVFFLYKVNQIGMIENSIEKSGHDTLVSVSGENIGWLSRLNESGQSGYFFPVNEIYLDLDLNQKIVHEILYQLVARINDPYQLFCLKEELRSFGFRYFLQQDKTGTKLLIQSKNITKLQSLVETLKQYQIMATVAPFKEEEAWKNIK